MNALDPKGRFMRSTEQAGKHRTLCVSPDFLAAVDAALLRYSEQLHLNYSNKQKQAAANYHKMVGAREFAKVLLNLSEKPDLPKMDKAPSLNYNA